MRRSVQYNRGGSVVHLQVPGWNKHHTHHTFVAMQVTSGLTCIMCGPSPSTHARRAGAV